MAKRQSAEDDLPETIDGEPLDQWLRFRCFVYQHSEKPPPPKFVRLLMRFVRERYPQRRPSPKEIAARVDHAALVQPSLRQAIAHVADALTITENGMVLQKVTKTQVKYAHRKYGHPVAELNRERRARRVKWTAADDSKKWVAEKLLEQTNPKPPGAPKGPRLRSEK